MIKPSFSPLSTGERPGAVVPARSGRLLVAGRRRVGFLDWNSGNIETVVERQENPDTMRFNDSKCDPVGRFWTGK